MQVCGRVKKYKIASSAQCEMCTGRTSERRVERHDFPGWPVPLSLELKWTPDIGRLLKM
jgi:hypothetical protein